MDNIAKSEYKDANKEKTKKEIEQYKLKVACMSDDISTIVDRLVKAESVVRLIANTYHLTEATSYFNPKSINDTSIKS
jgi:hypothetical protein